MARIAITAFITLLLAACGGGIDSYGDAVQRQSELMTEMILVLEDVDDEDDAEDAAEEIEELGRQMGELAMQMRELPRPSQEEMMDISQKQAELNAGFQQKASEQMMKLGQYPVLAEAWSRAMMNLR